MSPHETGGSAVAAASLQQICPPLVNAVGLRDLCANQTFVFLGLQRLCSPQILIQARLNQQLPRGR